MYARKYSIGWLLVCAVDVMSVYLPEFESERKPNKLSPLFILIITAGRGAREHRR